MFFLRQNCVYTTANQTYTHSVVNSLYNKTDMNEFRYTICELFLILIKYSFDTLANIG